jgi:hypothetical protein
MISFNGWEEAVKCRGMRVDCHLSKKWDDGQKQKGGRRINEVEGRVDKKEEGRG